MLTIIQGDIWEQGKIYKLIEPSVWGLVYGINEKLRKIYLVVRDPRFSSIDIQEVQDIPESQIRNSINTSEMYIKR